MTTQASREALLRTTADVVEHALCQLDTCRLEWPELSSDVDMIEESVEHVVARAQRVGYTPKVRHAR